MEANLILQMKSLPRSCKKDVKAISFAFLIDCTFTFLACLVIDFFLPDTRFSPHRFPFKLYAV